MSVAKISRPVPRIALDPTEAATALGVGLTFFKSEIAPDLRVVRRGSKRLYPILDLERWVDENAEKVIDDAA